MIPEAPPELNNNPSAYDQEDLALADDPTILPTDIQSFLIEAYQKSFMGRGLLGERGSTLPITMIRREQAPTGGVNWINEKGGWKKIDFKHALEMVKIEPFGVYFDVTQDELDFSQVTTIARNTERAAYEMAAFADALIYQEILDKCPTVSGSFWNVYSGDTKGDPITDLGNGQIKVRTATKQAFTPDTCILSDQMDLRMKGFDYIRNSLYNDQNSGQGGFVATGNNPRILGMNILKDNASDPSDAGQAIVLRSKLIGDWVQVRPLQIIYVEGKYLGNPDIAWRYWLKEQGWPSIESPELGAVVTGLKYTASG